MDAELARDQCVPELVQQHARERQQHDEHTREPAPGQEHEREQQQEAEIDLDRESEDPAKPPGLEHGGNLRTRGAL